MNKPFDIYRRPKLKPPVKVARFRYVKQIGLGLLTVMLIVTLVPLFQAFEAHMINVTADLVQIDAPIMTPPGPLAYDDTDGALFTDPITVFIVEFDSDATDVYYTFGSGTDPGIIPDPVCGDVLGGPKNDVHSVDVTDSTVIKAIACDGATADAHRSAVNTKIFQFLPAVVAPLPLPPDSITDQAGDQSLENTQPPPADVPTGIPTDQTPTE